MVNKDFFKALEELEETRRIKKEYFIEALEAALTSAYKKIMVRQKMLMLFCRQIRE